MGIEQRLELVDLYAQISRHQGCHTSGPASPGVADAAGKGEALFDGIIPLHHFALFAAELLAEQLHGEDLLGRLGGFITALAWPFVFGAALLAGGAVLFSGENRSSLTAPTVSAITVVMIVIGSMSSKY